MIKIIEEFEDQHSLVKSIFLHLIPGFLITVFLVSFTPFLLILGLTPEYGLLFGFVFIGEPLQLGYMLYLGRKKNKKFSLQGIVLNRVPQPRGDYFYTPLLAVAAIFIISFIISPINLFLSSRLFSWLPYWLLYSDPLFYTNSILVIQVIFVFQLIVDGIINPIIESKNFAKYSYWRSIY